MAPLLSFDATVEDPIVGDDEFELDMRVVESTTPLVIMMCDTSDGCGQSCSTTACTTSSLDPS